MTIDSTRRTFLKGAASLFGASAVLYPFDLRAEEPQADVWAFASDMHIADWTNKPPEHNVRFQETVAAMFDVPVKPHRLFLLGDNVAHGEQGQYKRLLEILKPVVESGISIHAVMGDHDNREHFRAIRKQLLSPNKNEAGNTHIVRSEPFADGEDKHAEILETKRANFFLLDSLVEPRQEWGTFGKEQLDWLAAELDQRKDKPAIVMAHHPAVDVGNAGLTDSIPFWKLMGAHRQVKAYFFGHTHVWLNYRIGRVHQVNFPSTFRCPPLTVLGWVLMTLHDDGAVLMLKTCDPKNSQNGQKVELKWG